MGDQKSRHTLSQVFGLPMKVYNSTKSSVSTTRVTAYARICGSAPSAQVHGLAAWSTELGS